MRSYLIGDDDAEKLVHAFFDRRLIDINHDWAVLGDQPWAPSADGSRWEALFSRLFNACEDLDMFPDSEEKATPNWIDEPTFRKQIAGILLEFESFTCQQ